MGSVRDFNRRPGYMHVLWLVDEALSSGLSPPKPLVGRLQFSMQIVRLRPPLRQNGDDDDT